MTVPSPVTNMSGSHSKGILAVMEPDRTGQQTGQTDMTFRPSKTGQDDYFYRTRYRKGGGPGINVRTNTG